MQHIFPFVKETPNLTKSKKWLLLLEETKQLVEQFHSKTNQLAQELMKHRYNNQSIQQYKKFL
ncbi:flagellar rod protein [Candidatus Photodesmus katoptron]|nr:flagellar rod protein [Candidatus Photodesmus katoptron]